MSEHPLDLFDRFLRLREAGTPMTRDEFLAAHPDHPPELRAALDDFLLADAEVQRAVPPIAPVAYSAGTPFGEFVLVRKIGAGAMGVVYEAEQKSLGRRVALKVMNANRPGFTRERFLREASLAARLQHEHVAAVHSIGEHDGACWFAMELVRGAPLDAVIARLKRRRFVLRTGADLFDAVSAEIAHCHGPLPGGARTASTIIEESYEDAVCRLVIGLADALEHAHRNGVIHRDVKPSNVLVRENGSPVLTDFGLAIGGDQDRFTREGDFAGTPLYSSPEQAEGRVRAIGATSDVFSLGVTLYELLAMRRPFSGDSLREVLTQIQSADPSPPRRMNPHVSIDLQTIVLKALEKSPERRYATAEEFAADLRRVLARDPILARPPSLLERSRRLLRRRAVPAIVLVAVCAIVWSAWSARDAVVRAERQDALFSALLAAREGRPLSPEDRERLCRIIEDPELLAWLLTDPSDPRVLARFHDEYLSERSGLGDPPIHLDWPRMGISAMPQELRVAFSATLRKALGTAANLEISISDSDLGITEPFARVEFSGPTAETINIPFAALGAPPLEPDRRYKVRVELDRRFHGERFAMARGSTEFFVASEKLLSEIRHVGGTRNDASDKLLRAAREVEKGLCEDAIRHIRELSPTLDPMRAGFARSLEAEALARLGDKTEGEALLSSPSGR